MTSSRALVEHLMRERVAKMRAAGTGYAVIAAEVGVSKSTVYRWCNPEIVAETERRRRARKEAWHRENYRGRCACGALTGSRQYDRCKDCDNRDRAVEHEIRLSIAEGMWADGWMMRDIAEAFGYTLANHASPLIDEVRKQGRAPYRYRAYERELAYAA
jgi:transposase